MAILRDRAKRCIIHDDSCPAGVDLSAFQWHVIDTTTSGGIESAIAPTGQGANFRGVLVNAPTAGEQAHFSLLGDEEIVCASAISAGDEVTVAGVAGTIETAAAADYVVGTAREDGVAAQCISVHLRKYQKNA